MVPGTALKKANKPKMKLPTTTCHCKHQSKEIHTVANNFHNPSLLTSTKSLEKKKHNRNTRNRKHFSSASATLKIHPHITLNEVLLLPTPNDPTLAADGGTSLYK